LVLEYFKAIGPERTAAFYRDELITQTGIPTAAAHVRSHQSGQFVFQAMVDGRNEWSRPRRFVQRADSVRAR
jgi:hypothetical protein